MNPRPPVNWYALGGRAAAVVVLAAGVTALASRLPGLFAVRPLPGFPVLHPASALAFVLCGACLWLCLSPAPPLRIIRALAGAAVAVLGGAFALNEARGSRIFEDTAVAEAAAVGCMGIALFLLDGRSPRVRALAQLPMLPVAWLSYLSLAARFYGHDAPEAHFRYTLLPAGTSLLLCALGAGILLARPGQGIMAVITSPFSGGAMARVALPIILLLPFTIGWIRVRALRTGGYDLETAFAQFSSTNVLAFGGFILFSAHVLNRLDARRRLAFESLQAAHRELQRVNEALQDKISEHNRTEEARKKTELQLFQSQKMEAMGTLASGIAHDFNNLLTVILLNAETAREISSRDPLLQKSLQEIKKSGTRAADLIRQIMTFGRKNPGERKAVQPAEVVSEAVEMLRAALPSSLQIRTTVEAGAPAILADPNQIQQVLLNLGTNAAHAMAEKGGILEIRVKALTVTPDEARLSADLRAGSYALLTVRDTGHGMDGETLKRVFDPFFTTKPPGKGTGLGLSVAHGIVRLHEGCITVHSEPGRGTVFNVYLPVAAGENPQGSG